MEVYGLQLPDKPLTNFDLEKYVKKINIPNFRGVFMWDSLPQTPNTNECGIVNFNKSSEPGSHWVAYYKAGDRRIYFDSFGQVTLYEVQKYLKKKCEEGKKVIQRNTDIVQQPNTSICGHLCLHILKSLSNGMSFRDALNSLKLGKEFNGQILWRMNYTNPYEKIFPKDTFLFETRMIFGGLIL